MSAALDLRSKEEKDAELDKRIEALRKKNEALIRRYQEIEEDRRKAEQEGVAVTTLRRTRPPHPEFDGRRATRGVAVTVVPHTGEKRVTRDKKPPGVPKPPRGSGRSPRGDPTPPAEPFWEGGAGDGGTVGGRGRRARGRGAAAPAMGGDGPDRKSKEWEERRRQNIEKMNEEMEKIAEYERNQRDGLNEKNPVRNFLDDPRRSGPVLDADRREGSRRHVRNWGGADFDKVKAGMERDKTRQGPTGRRPSPKAGVSLDMTLSMTGRERAEYVRWKQEREQIDRERLARHRKPGGQWRREWDAEKPDGGFKDGPAAADPSGGDQTKRFPPKPPTFGEFLTPRRPQRRRKSRGGGNKSYSMHDNRWEEKEPPAVAETTKQEVEEALSGAPPEEDEDEWEDVSEDEAAGDSAGTSSEGQTPRRLSPVEPLREGHNPQDPPKNETTQEKTSPGNPATQGAAEFPPDAVEITDFERDAPRCL
ncbi:coiled-coil domain-containing protein 9 [Caloenas nicobarica]|uniref:coiled-coil domain-containing protein 9 n=1 Tax=Caloenas nicobarica TaxID=187106 RepID=UPI0032B8530F